jgi:hypothetical protein
VDALVVCAASGQLISPLYITFANLWGIGIGTLPGSTSSIGCALTYRGAEAAPRRDCPLHMAAIRAHTSRRRPRNGAIPALARPSEACAWAPVYHTLSGFVQRAYDSGVYDKQLESAKSKTQVPGSKFTVGRTHFLLPLVMLEISGRTCQ